LDFIHDDPLLVALRNPIAEALGRGEQLGVDLIIEHVEEQGVGKGWCNQAVLPTPRGPNKKKLCRGSAEVVVHT
jgi:hypothetical protein